MKHTHTLFVMIVALVLSGLMIQVVFAAEPMGKAITQTTPAAIDTPLYQNPFEVIITASRMEIPLKQNPAATTVVDTAILHTMPKTIAVDEALRMVPGVRIDNGSTGSRVHMSIRGQGILTERGIRGIKILLDGIPLNDPTGFAPDFYDVDWSTVEKIEVLRGPAAAFYGGGSSAGVINIQTEDGSNQTASAKTSQTAGSYGFGKSVWQIGGTTHGVNYRASESYMKGNGYRAHQTFYGNNFYFKAHAEPVKGLLVSPVVSSTDFYNDNSEGLNYIQIAENRRMPNNDAIPFNEGLGTRRATYGLTADWKMAEQQQLQFTGFFRYTNFFDAGNVSVDHQRIKTPGSSLQYNLTHDLGTMKNHVIAGGDFSYQTIDEYKNENIPSGASGEHHEGARQSDQTINQSGEGIFLMDRLELNKNWGVMVCGRYDDVRNKLTDNFEGDSIRLSGSRNFNKPTARIGIAFTPRDEINAFANWGQGFLPPATEELTHNPVQIGGFNNSIESATSQGEEIGIRGIFWQKLTYDVSGFYLTTDNDFDRYRGVAPRDQETFYRNLGTSKRTGAEAYLSYSPVRPLHLQFSYTYSHFKYNSPDLLNGKFLPNCPKSQFATDAEFEVVKHLSVGADLESQSGWYVDATNTIFQKGFTTVGAHITWGWQLASLHGEFSLSGKNIFGEKYMGFTEPDDGGDYRDLRPLDERNSFQPAPTQEVFAGVKLEM